MPKNRIKPDTHDITLSDDQLMMFWRLTEMSCPQGGDAIDILSSLRGLIRKKVQLVTQAQVQVPVNGSPAHARSE